MNRFKDEGLEITLTEGATNILTWKGKSESRTPSDLLMPYFRELAEKLKGKELVVEFNQLKYMNSATVASIIQLIKYLEENGTDSTLAYDRHSKWQLASFKVLESLARTMKHIRVVGV
jgi:hypothetical protein